MSPAGRAAHDAALALLDDRDGVAPGAAGLWSSLEAGRGREPSLDTLLMAIEAPNSTEADWLALETWLTENATGRDVSLRFLSPSGEQQVIGFQTAELDWHGVVDLESALSASAALLSDDHSTSEEEVVVRVSGRSFLLAQITEEVSTGSIASTILVAVVILAMLVGINTVRHRDPIRGVFTWVPLLFVVVWVYGLLGLVGYQLNSQSITIGALTLGLGVDYAIHFSTRLEQQRAARPTAGIASWTSQTVATTGRAMMGAALTTAGGFGILNFSGVVPIRLFGQVFVVAILLALVSSLILLPALLGTRMRAATGSSTGPSPATQRESE